MHSKKLSGFRDDVRLHYGSRDFEKATAFNREYGGGGAWGSYEAALGNPDLHVAFIATPPASHLELSLQAMRAGKDVIVEKPPFLRSSDFERVRAVQSETGRRVLVAENYYYKPLAVRLRKILRDGWIGEVRFVLVNALKKQVTEDWRDDEQLSGGGALFEGGIHWINFVANLGMTIESVRGFGKAAERGLERSVVVALKYVGGAAGAVYYSWEIPSLLRGLRLSKIFGLEGSLTFESNGLFIVVNGVRKRLIIPGMSDITGSKAMFRDFIRALRTGEEAQMNLDLAERDLQLVETVYESMTDIGTPR
jgi:predicted dehydrogenase